MCEINESICDAQTKGNTGHIIHIWVILLKTDQNCDREGKNSKCEFF